MGSNSNGFDDYKDVAELLRQIVYETDSKGNITYANPVAYELFRYPRDLPFTDMNIFQMIAPEDHERAKLNFKLSMKNHNYNKGNEYIGLRNDGTKFPIKIFTSPISHNNNIHGLRGIILDITHEKRLKHDSKENMKRFYSFFENIGDACVILKSYDAGESFIVYDINFESEKLSNFKREDIIGVNIEDILNILKGSEILEIFRRVYLTGNKEYYSYYKYENNRVLFWIDTQVFRLSSGEIVLVYDDVTEAKRIQESLKMNKTKYKNLFNSNPCYMTLIDINGMIVEMNNSLLKLTGLKKEEVIGKHFMEVNILCEKDKHIYQNYKDLFHDYDESQTKNVRIIDKEGNYHWVKHYFSKIEFNGETKLVLVINVDITNEKLYDDQLRAALYEKEILIKEIHHRVKNNMQIISSLLNLQKSCVQDDEAVNILLESQNRVRSMALIHEKLYASDNLTDIHIKNYINNLVEDLLFSYKVDKNDLKYEINVEDIIFGIETAIPLGLILTEIISNSIKYAFTDEGPNYLFLTLKSKKIGFYELLIKDNGPGIPFNLINGNNKTLGLILIKNLVNQLEGSLEFNNNDGTEIKIIFKELYYENRM